LTVRYAISSEAELCTFAGESDPRVAELAVEAHLIEAARALLALPPAHAH
jgi:hypothetical protein